MGAVGAVHTDGSHAAGHRTAGVAAGVDNSTNARVVVAAEAGGHSSSRAEAVVAVCCNHNRRGVVVQKDTNRLAAEVVEEDEMDQNEPYTQNSLVQTDILAELTDTLVVPLTDTLEGLFLAALQKSFHHSARHGADTAVVADATLYSSSDLKTLRLLSLASCSCWRRTEVECVRARTG